MTENQRFRLNTEGFTLFELVENVEILEFDQDGEEINQYMLDDMSDELREAVFDVLESHLCPR